MLTGPYLPEGFQGIRPMAESSHGVLLFGGDDGLDGTNKIFELQAGGNWTILNITLEEERMYHTAIPIQ